MKKTAKAKSQSRKVSELPTRIYKYGATPVSEKDREILSDQVFQAHLYQGTLCTIERTRRNEFRALRRRLDPLLDRYETAVDKIREEQKALRKGISKKSERETPEQQALKAQIKALGEQKKDLFKEISNRVSIVMANFKEGDAYYAEQKNQRLEARAKELGKEQIAPNDKANRQAIVDALAEEILESSHVSETWKEKFRIEQKAYRAGLEARANKPCFSSTGCGVEEAFKQSAKMSKGDPSTKPFMGNGRVKMIQPTGKDKGLPVASIPQDFSQKGRLVMVPLSQKGTRGETLMSVRLKVADDVHVHVTIPYHRPLPEDGLIKHVYVLVRTVGYVPTYELHFVLEANFPRLSKGEGHIALNFGWRTMPGAFVRVATAWDGKEFRHFDLTYRSNGVNRSVNEAHSHIKYLLSTSDYHFDAAKEELVTWLKKGEYKPSLLKVINKAMPSHLQATHKTLPKMLSVIVKWRSHGKLIQVVRALLGEVMDKTEVATLWRTWVAMRKQRGEDLYFHVEHAKGEDIDARKQTAQSRTRDEFKDFYKFLEKKGVKDPTVQKVLALEWWARKDEHLINWARNLDLRFARHRKNTYQIWAKQLRQTYSTITIEKWDKSETAETPESEDDMRTPQEKSGNTTRQRVGISIFVAALKEAFGSDLEEVDASKINTHYKCGGKPLHKLTPSPTHMCDQCSRLYDQDCNSAQHLWAKRETPPKRERRSATPKTATARTPKKRSNSGRQVQVSV